MGLSVAHYFICKMMREMGARRMRCCLQASAHGRALKIIHARAGQTTPFHQRKTYRIKLSEAPCAHNNYGTGYSPFDQSDRSADTVFCHQTGFCRNISLFQTRQMPPYAMPKY